jgi:hypothetical protein
MKIGTFVFILFIWFSEAIAQENPMDSNSTKSRGVFNHKYRYTVLGGGPTFLQWDNRNLWVNKDISPSFQLFVGRRYTGRLLVELNLQYLHGSSYFQTYKYKTI